MYRIPNSAVAIVPETALESRANFVIAGIFHLKSVMEILNIKNPADIGPNCSMLSNVISPPTVISRHCSNTGETGAELRLTVPLDRPYGWNPAVPPPGIGSVSANHNRSASGTGKTSMDCGPAFHTWKYSLFPCGTPLIEKTTQFTSSNSDCPSRESRNQLPLWELRQEIC